MPVTIYPFPAGAPENHLYDVFVNQERVTAHEARVSAVPFNRHWPGHQRTLDQTELIPFISFEMTEPTEVRVAAHADVDSAVVRPSSQNIRPLCRGREITFTIPRPGQYSLEINGSRGALLLFGIIN